MYTYNPISPPSCVSLPPSLSHPSRSLKSTELISMCYAAASHQLSILHLVVYICQCYSLTSSQLPIPPHVLKSVLYIWIFINPATSFISTIFLDSIYMHQHMVFLFLYPFSVITPLYCSLTQQVRYHFLNSYFSPSIVSQALCTHYLIYYFQQTCENKHSHFYKIKKK